MNVIYKQKDWVVVGFDAWEQRPKGAKGAFISRASQGADIVRNLCDGASVTNWSWHELTHPNVQGYFFAVMDEKSYERCKGPVTNEWGIESP